MNICYGVKDNCYNISDSYDAICVWCNCCGRVDKKTMYQCRIDTEKRHLAEEANDLFNSERQTELQQKNILSNIAWYLKRIKQSQKMIKEEKHG